jgi:hypothetical protein
LAVSDQFKVIDDCVQDLYYTLLRGDEKIKDAKIAEKNRKWYYLTVKPVLSMIVDRSKDVHSGFMIAHTAYYLMQTLNELFDHDPAAILLLAAGAVDAAVANSFTYDGTTLAQIVKLSERIMADHKNLLDDPDLFNALLSILDHFANSGWQEALELTWKLKDIF